MAMRFWMPMLVVWTVSGQAAAAGSIDELVVGDLAPLSTGEMATSAGFSDSSVSFLSTSPGDQAVALSSVSSVSGTITGSPIAIAAGFSTGSIGPFSSSAGGGISSIQLSTGLGNLQQNSISVVMAFGS